MKTKLFFFAMIVSIAASAQVTNVAPIGANYANKTVSFRVWWNANSRDATHLSKVWVWVDYITVNSNNTTSGNTWTRAAVSSASPTASVSYDGSNRKGFWLQGNNGSYSATVTVQLNITASKFNWCAYVSDYPPNVTANNGTYTFKGTPPFRLIASDGTTTQTVSGKTLTTSDLTITPTTIRDKTECPGVFCIYNGSDLYIDATHLCQQRTTGAQNWEAWIKDSRDKESYRIVLMPDNKWWLAQNVKFAQTGTSVTISGCTPDKCGRGYTAPQMRGAWGGSSGTGENIQGVCPSGWVLPMFEQWRTMRDAISSDKPTVCSRLRPLDSPCGNAVDYYGWASIMKWHKNNTVGEAWANWRTNDAVHSHIGIHIDATNACYSCCGTYHDEYTPGEYPSSTVPVRCLR